MNNRQARWGRDVARMVHGNTGSEVSDMSAIIWRYSPSGDDEQQLGRFPLRANVFIYVVVERTAHGWQWEAYTNKGKPIASCGHFGGRIDAERDVTAWASDYGRRVTT